MGNRWTLNVSSAPNCGCPARTYLFWAIIESNAMKKIERRIEDLNIWAREVTEGIGSS
jgi:hypothetical protein